MSEREDLLREFELIQRVIERQADNSFKIKGWTVTLIVVAIVFRTNDFQLIGAFVPLLAFWGLDAYFLRQEKMYRELYDWVRENRPENQDHSFDLDATRFEDEVEGLISTMRTPTLLWFYLPIAILLTLYTVFVFITNGGGVYG